MLPATLSTCLKLCTGLLGAGALLLTLTASECQQDIHFTQALKETCSDGIDNDHNGKVDCADSECLIVCTLDLAVFTPVQTSADTQTISGTHRRAASIAVNIKPDISASGKATLEGSTWSYKVTKLQAGSNEITIIASDSSGQTKTVTTSITRSP